MHMCKYARTSSLAIPGMLKNYQEVMESPKIFKKFNYVPDTSWMKEKSANANNFLPISGETDIMAQKDNFLI